MKINCTYDVKPHQLGLLLEQVHLIRLHGGF